MDSQAFDRNRRVFILASAVAAAGAVVAFGAACDTPQGMRAPKSPTVPGGGTRAGQNPAGMNGAPPAQPSDQPPNGTTKPADPPAKTDGTDKPQTIDRPEPPSKEPAIRIKTREVPPTKPLVVIEGYGPKVWLVEKGSGKGGVVAHGPVEARWTKGAWQITEMAGTARARAVAYQSRGTLDVTCLTNEPQRIKVDGVEWPGSVRLVPAGGAFDLVHEVAMETYLSGVIAKELMNSWAVETHRAQAIAARSYAVCEMAVWRPQRHYDVVADERSQAWVGTTNHAKSLDAVRDTAGQMLVFDGRVVPAYYSSCCGGARASAQDTISSEIRHDIAPLRAASGRKGCACTGFSKHARWEMTLAVPAVSRVLPAWARIEGYPSLARIGEVRQVEVVSRNELGRPVRVRIVDAKGWRCELSAERLRWALSANPSNPAEKKPLNERVKSAYFEPAVKGSQLVLKGAGYGHGVGLCQYGSEAMAKSGTNAAAILANYYPSARLVRAYG
jgi:stage II sporulation protein D